MVFYLIQLFVLQFVIISLMKQMSDSENCPKPCYWVLAWHNDQWQRWKTTLLCASFTNPLAAGRKWGGEPVYLIMCRHLEEGTGGGKGWRSIWAGTWNALWSGIVVMYHCTAVPGIKLFLQVMVTLLYQGKKWWADLTCSGRHVGRWALEGRPGQPGGRLGRNLVDFLKMWGQVLNYEMAHYHCLKKLTLNDMNLRK